MPGRTAGAGGGGVQIPAQLAQAESLAAAKYGVPYSLLTGIWRKESHSTFPNPAVNSSGYGGLFGTKNWNAPTQAQANTAASILAAGFKQSQGDYIGALSYYNRGRTNDPRGKIYAESVLALSGAGANVASGKVSTRPGGGGGSFWGRVWGGVTGAASSVEHAAAGAFSSAERAAEDVITGPLDFLKAALFLVDPVNWLRAFETLLGVVLIVLGVVLPLKDSIPTPAAPIADLAKAAAK